MSGFWDDVNAQSVASAKSGFPQFEIGENEAFIDQVIQKKSQAGSKMLEIFFKKKDGAEIRHYIVEGEWKLSKLKQLYESFNIPFGNQEIGTTWLRKTGIVVCKEGKPREGKVYPEVSYLKALSGNEQGFSQQGQDIEHPAFTDDIPF